MFKNEMMVVLPWLVMKSCSVTVDVAVWGVVEGTILRGEEVKEKRNQCIGRTKQTSAMHTLILTCTHRHARLLQKCWGACNSSVLSVFSPDALQWVFMKKGALPEGDYWLSPGPGKKAARGKTATTQTVSMAERRPRLQQQGQVQSSGWWFGERSFWGEKSEKISEAWEVRRLGNRHVEGKDPGLLALIDPSRKQRQDEFSFDSLGRETVYKW